MASLNEHHREVIVTTEKYPVRFFRSRDRGSYVPYHYHDAFEFIYLTRGSMSLSSLPNHNPLSCFVAKLPALPQHLPVKISFDQDAAQEAAAAAAAAQAEAEAVAAAKEAELEVARNRAKSSHHIGLAEQEAASLAPLLETATTMRPSSSHPQNPRIMELMERMENDTTSLRSQAEALLFSTPETPAAPAADAAAAAAAPADSTIANSTEPTPADTAPADAATADTGAAPALKAETFSSALADQAPATTEDDTAAAASTFSSDDAPAVITADAELSPDTPLDHTVMDAPAAAESTCTIADSSAIASSEESVQAPEEHLGRNKGLKVQSAWQDKKASAMRHSLDGGESEDEDELQAEESSTFEMTSFSYNFALINSNEMHASSCQSFNEAYVLQIPEKFFTELCGYSEAFPLYLNPHLASQNCLERFSRAYLRLAVIHEHYQQKPGFLIHFNHALYAILECLMEMIVPVATLNQIQNDLDCSLIRSANLKRLQPVFEFLKHHYHERIKLEQMAAVAHLHPGYFCQFFKDAVGMSPLNYLSELRLCHIYYDLVERKQPVTEILQRHGFTNAKKFYRIFKERFGKSPSEVKQLHGTHTSPSYRGYSYFERLYHRSQLPDDTAMALGISPRPDPAAATAAPAAAPATAPADKEAPKDKQRPLSSVKSRTDISRATSKR